MPVTISESDAYPTTLQFPQATELASAPGLLSQYGEGVANRTNWLKNRSRPYRLISGYDADIAPNPTAANANFADVVTLSANRVWQINDTGCVGGDWMAIRNRSAFSVTLVDPSAVTLAVLEANGRDFVLCIRDGSTWRLVFAELASQNIKRNIATLAGITCTGAGAFSGFVSTASFFTGINRTQFATDTLTDTDQTVDRNTVHYGAALPNGACTWTINTSAEVNGEWVKFHRGTITTNIIISSSSGTLITLSTGVAHWAECVRIGGTWRVVASGL